MSGDPTNPMNQTIPPRTRFLKTPAAKIWAENVTTDVVRSATETALAQFVFEQDDASATDQSAAQAAYRLQGARRYMAILLNLAEREVQKPIKMAGDNLPNET